MSATILIQATRRCPFCEDTHRLRLYGWYGRQALLPHQDAEQAGTTHFLAMEYVEGITLTRRVTEQGPLPVAAACDYVRQAALGLQHAYERGMVHRDIKPQNLMLTHRGSEASGRQVADSTTCPSPGEPTQTTGAPERLIKILDFGLARFASELGPDLGAATVVDADTVDQGISRIIRLPGLTDSGVVVGTPDFIAPEQARDSRAADIRADIYSLGCTLYYLLTGRGPYPTGSVVDKVLGHLTGSPRPLAELRGDVPAELATVIEKMMAKDPTARYQTPTEVADALAPFAAGWVGTTREAPGRATTKSERKPRNVGRRLAALAALAAVLAVGSFVAQQVRIRIKDKQGQVKEFTAAPGSTVDIDTDARVTISESASRMDPRPVVRRVWANAGSVSNPSPDGKYAAAVVSVGDGSRGGRLVIRDLASGTERTLVERSAYGPLLSRDGQQVAVSLSDRTSVEGQRSRSLSIQKNAP